MRLGNYLRVFSALSVLLLWHSPASAEDYSWGGRDNSKHPSPESACRSWIVNQTYSIRVIQASETSFYCDYREPDRTAWKRYTTVGRSGDSCAPGTEYNAATGECAAPENPCSDKSGIEEGFSKAGTAPDSFMTISSTGYGIPQRQGCKGGCATEATRIDCNTKVAGPYFCRGTAIYSGQQCATTGDGGQIDEDVNESTDPQTVKEDVPCIYSPSGDKQVCESKKSVENEGQSCGTVNGEEVCINKAPDKNGIDIRTEVTQKILEDGSTEITKKDTATVTSCKGIKTCTSTVTTTTTITTKDANGNTTGTKSNCTGPSCPKGDEGGEGSGNSGICLSGICSPDGESGSGGNVTPPELEDVPEYADTVEGYFNRIKNAPIIASITNLSVPSGGSCPTYSASHEYFGSVNTGVFCDMGPDLLGMLRYVFLAIWAWVAIRTFMTA